MTGFHQYASVALSSVRKNCPTYTETIVACVSAGNEATVHCVLLHELIRFSSFQKPQKTFPPPPTGPNFASEICSGSTFFHMWEVVQFFRGSPYSKISSGDPYLSKKLALEGTNFAESIFAMTGPRNKAMKPAKWTCTFSVCDVKCIP